MRRGLCVSTVCGPYWARAGLGVHQLDGYRPKRHWPGPEDCCSEPGSDPLSHFAYLQAKGYQEHRKEGVSIAARTRAGEH
jgi:hypothetical protein